VWRYSRIDELQLDDFAIQPDDEVVAGVGGSASVAGGLDTVTPAATIDLVDGRLVAASAAPGLTISSSRGPDDLDHVLGAVAGDGSEPFVDLNTAFTPEVVVITAARGAEVVGPVLLTHHVTADGAAVFPRIVVQAGEGSRVTILERSVSADIHALVVPVVELDVARGAQLSYLSLQELGPRVWQLANQVSRVGQEATLLAGSVALGGDYARLRTDCRLEGRGATGTLLAAYFGEGHQSLDFRTFQDHRAPDTTSNLLFKGVVGDHSRSVYTGLIRVRKEARGTNAFQTNRNIKLSEHAWAESVPNLEIENNDVHCSHASTVGPIDDDQRFYLESRGVPPLVAERLVVAGFFDEVITQLPVEGLADPLRVRINEKIDRAGSEAA